MFTQDLLDYIKSETGRGVAKPTILEALLHIGWSSQDVEEAWSAVFSGPRVAPTAPIQPIRPTPPIQQPIQPARPIQQPAQSFQPARPIQPTIQRPMQQPVQPAGQPVQRPLQQPIQQPIRTTPAYQPYQAPVRSAVEPFSPSYQAPVSAQTKTAGIVSGPLSSNKAPVATQAPAGTTTTTFSSPRTSFTPQADARGGIHVYPVKKSASGMLVKVIVIVLVVVGIAVAIFYRQFIVAFVSSLLSRSETIEAKITNAPKLPAEQANDSNTSPAPATDTNSDDAGIRASFEKIREATINGDIALMTEYSSSKSLDFFKSLGDALGAPKVIKMKDMTLDAIKKIDDNTTLVTVTNINLNDRKDTNDLIFVNESGVWKMGTAETMEYLKNKATDTPGGNPTDGYVDFVITDIKVYPNSPKVNSPDTEIEVTVKNQGSMSSDKKGVSAKGEIVGSDYIPVDGGLLYTIDAGQTVKWTFHPYPKFFVGKHHDGPGKKTVTVTLNATREVSEKDYSNNSFSKEFTFTE